MAITTKRFNWVQQASAWKQAEAWRERRKLMRQDFDTAASFASTGLINVWSNQITGSANLAAEAALKRLDAAKSSSVNKTA